MLKITSRQKSLRPAEYLVLASQSLTTLILHYFKLFTKFVVPCATAPLPPCPTSSQALRSGSQPDSDAIPHASTLNFNAHSVQTLTCSHTRATPPASVHGREHAKRHVPAGGASKCDLAADYCPFGESSSKGHLNGEGGTSGRYLAKVPPQGGPS